ncbi:class I SAM-dependent methyltransferase [Salinirubrum litoreum]|uniref:Class I SAM-dependent methyltransferase n=1 Tax=Salinirubrum litoreum TaxID=1126234 RepID=A0ABD5RGK8_9EURY|nr:methyltransferase domain-containing protein [Salinirubrum litoreum]
MDDPGRDAQHRSELDRSRRRWDFWSSRWGLVEADTVAVRRETIHQLDLETGDTVLDLGCGPGVNFEMLREVVGPAGQVIAVDLSRAMLKRAQARIDEHGWENVNLLQADATTPVVANNKLDGVVATTAVSATPDVTATVQCAYDSLRPGGRFAVYEIRLVPEGPPKVLNPLIRRFYRLFGNWNSEEDVWLELRARFDAAEFIRAFALGTNYIAVAEKATDEGSPST